MKMISHSVVASPRFGGSLACKLDFWAHTISKELWEIYISRVPEYSTGKPSLLKMTCSKTSYRWNMFNRVPSIRNPTFPHKAPTPGMLLSPCSSDQRHFVKRTPGGEDKGKGCRRVCMTSCIGDVSVLSYFSHTIRKHRGLSEFPNCSENTVYFSLGGGGSSRSSWEEVNHH